ncbi:MAG: LysR family transcriptional regulator [Anaeromyxobacter sp.]
MQSRIDWDDLRFLLAAHQAGSFARAARRLGVDPATVGRRLRALREAVGAPLLEGPPGRVTLTGAGLRALEAARRMDEAALALEPRAGEAEVTGTLRIAATEALAARVLAPRLGELTAAHPGLRVELVTGNEPVSLSRREADLAVRLFRPAEPGLVIRRAGTLAFAPYVARAAAGRRGAPGGLEGRPLVGYIPELARSSAPLAWVDEVPGGAVVLRASGAFALLAAVEAGLGAGVLPCFLGDGSPGLARLGAEVRTRELWLVVHGELRRSPRNQAGLAFLARVLAEAGPRLRGEASPPRVARRRRVV